LALEEDKRLRRLLAVAALAALPICTPVCGWTAPQPAAGAVTYDVQQPPAEHGSMPQGWGLFATLDGRSTDLGARDLQWSDDPHVQAHDVEAGYGWRSGAATAVIGYEDHDFGRAEQATAQERQDRDVHRFSGGSGVLGFSLVLHGH
jgi:hypothetical protein